MEKNLRAQTTKIHSTLVRNTNTSKCFLTCRALLERIYDQMRVNNPLLTKKNKLTIAPPQVGPLGTRKCVWGNFEEIIKSIDRKLEHAQSYVAAELGTEVNLNEKNQLVMKGRFTAKQIQAILKNYLKDYVKCNNCRSYKTGLNRDTTTRMYILK
jgi:translation initiation factor 2 subunit 2